MHNNDRCQGFRDGLLHDEKWVFAAGVLTGGIMANRTMKECESLWKGAPAFEGRFSRSAGKNNVNTPGRRDLKWPGGMLTSEFFVVLERNVSRQSIMLVRKALKRNFTFVVAPSQLIWLIISGSSLL